MAKIKSLLFIDTNIWLDFYRARNEAGLKLLRHLDDVADRIIVTHQLEMEFKKNRQAAILEGAQELKSPTKIAQPGIFSDAKALKAMQSGLKQADSRVKKMKAQLKKVLESPTTHDPVFKVCQRVFHKNDSLALLRSDKYRFVIRRRAWRRFILGCPPRKKGDTSIGDAINWEWMVECAVKEKAELIIVSRDSDYGANFDDITFVNDHLKQEFSERVSRQRKIRLYTRLSEALKHFEVPVTKQEEEEEEHIVDIAKTATSKNVAALLRNVPIQENAYYEFLKRFDAVLGADEADPTKGASE